MRFGSRKSFYIFKTRVENRNVTFSMIPDSSPESRYRAIIKATPQNDFSRVFKNLHRRVYRRVLCTLRWCEYNRSSLNLYCYFISVENVHTYSVVVRSTIDTNCFVGICMHVLCVVSRLHNIVVRCPKVSPQSQTRSALIYVINQFYLWYLFYCLYVYFRRVKKLVREHKVTKIVREKWE